MALPTAYLTSAKNLKPILEAMQTAQAPDKFTTRFLVSLGFSSSSDRLIIGVLKALGFLDQDGKPTDRYYRYLDQTQSEKVLAEGIREAYEDLFKIRTDAQNLSSAEVINKAKTLSQGSMSESVLKKFSLTFSSLVKLADFSDPVLVAGSPASVTEDETEDSTASEVEKSPSNPKRQTKSSLGGLHYNIQIILPATRDPAIYDALFKSLKEHIIE
ncbi:hypothetical protein EI983_13140 [Roseovarius faecimaris]|uniref:DUF5343 domain-containing protein n=1 Tax=Roseovarius faecimaris TaxID=2494550 RepID=A0A6I6ITD6_9RHOB|nr:DUF5343 domain-containing protein [Roseovarius faecimaris]QGX99163.1 hypothetical protein EI983_13140 [Roseovarius faecimaris]